MARHNVGAIIGFQAGTGLPGLRCAAPGKLGDLLAGCGGLSNTKTEAGGSL
jgi:hypothetical protein